MIIPRLLGALREARGAFTDEWRGPEGKVVHGHGPDANCPVCLDVLHIRRVVPTPPEPTPLGPVTSTLEPLAAWCDAWIGVWTGGNR